MALAGNNAKDSDIESLVQTIKSNRRNQSAIIDKAMSMLALLEVKGGIEKKYDGVINTHELKAYANELLDSK